MPRAKKAKEEKKKPLTFEQAFNIDLTRSGSDWIRRVQTPDTATMAKHSRHFGSDEPLHIFQDDNADITRPMTSHAPMPSVTKPARRPLGATDSNIVLDPPFAPQNATSPHKARTSTQRSPLKPTQCKRLNKVAMAPPGQGPQTDSLQKKPYLSNFKTARQTQPQDPSTQWANENAHVPIYPAPPALSKYPINMNGKRGLMDPAPIAKDTRPVKKARTDETTTLPPPDSFPPIVDDGQKPPHSYAQLIGMAILRSEHRRLTLASIYKWISDNFSYYNPNDAGWQNSIRHNLSLHKNFIKIERPKDDPGKGNYWGIEPGTEGQFLKEKPARKSAPSGENLPVMSTSLEPSRPATAPASEPGLPPPSSAAPAAHTALALPPQPPAMPSSDATIPEFDNAVAEETGGGQADNDVTFDTSLYSPAPLGMNSSPPVSRQNQAVHGTPCANRSSVSRSRKGPTESGGADDSGYISCLDSSVLRPTDRAVQSGSDKPRKKQKRSKDNTAGRAEVEIARLRNSSPYSPTKGRSKSVHHPVSSSPYQPTMTNAFGPLTPKVKLKQPVQHPPSVSPNTNLRRHRDMVQSMLKTPAPAFRMVEASEAIPYSPEFSLDESYYIDNFTLGNDNDGASHVFEGFSEDPLDWTAQGNFDDELGL